MEVPGSSTLSLKEQIILTVSGPTVSAQYAVLPLSTEVDSDHRQVKGHCSAPRRFFNKRSRCAMGIELLKQVLAWPVPLSGVDAGMSAEDGEESPHQLSLGKQNLSQPGEPRWSQR